MRQTSSQGGEEEIKFNWKRFHLFYKPTVIEILRNIIQNPIAKVVRVTDKSCEADHQFVRKPLPLTTVELQKAASRLLRLAPKKALDVRIHIWLRTITNILRDRRKALSARICLLPTHGDGPIRSSIRPYVSHSQANCWSCMGRLCRFVIHYLLLLDLFL